MKLRSHPAGACPPGCLRLRAPLLGALLASALAGSLAAREEPGPGEILARAAEAQGEPPARNERAPDVVSLQASMFLQVRDEKGNSLQLKAERKYLALGAEYLLNQVDEMATDTRTTLGFDGEHGWFRSNKERGVTILDGPEHQPDREKLRQWLDETRLFCRLFFLRNLAGEVTDWRRLADETGHGVTAYVLEGKGTHSFDGKDEPVSLRLWIDREDYRLMGARVAPEDGDREPLNLCFWDHARNQDGVVVPGTIKIFSGDEEKPSQVITGLDVDFDAPLEPADFQAPSTG